MQHSTWRLVARVVGFGIPLLIVSRTDDVANYYVYAVLAPGQVPTLMGSAAIPGTHPSFPYGLPVFPD